MPTSPKGRIPPPPKSYDPLDALTKPPYTTPILSKLNGGRPMPATANPQGRPKRQGMVVVRAKLPLRLRMEFVHRAPDGRLAHVTVLWTTLRRWAKRPESSERGWSPIAIGPFVVALRIEV